MSGRAPRMPRRTRVYDCNYNMGESYYRSALDDLDKKKTATPDIVDRILSRPKFDVDKEYENELSSSRRRAEKAICESSVLDTRSGKTSGKVFNSSALESEFDDELDASLSRIRASKKMSSLMNDLDLEDTINSVKRRSRIDMGEKLLDAAGEDEFGSSLRRRAIKMVTRSADRSNDSQGLTKWTQLSSIGEDSAAQLRAKASKARLNDIESEMFEQSEKQAARDRRSANLRKLLSDNDIETTKSSGSTMKITSRSEKRLVSFE